MAATGPEGLTVERPQTPQRQASIGDNQLRQRRALDFACDQSRHRAFGGHLGEIGMTIEARTGQRNEQLPRLDRPAVSADRREAGIGPHQTAGQRQLQLAQSHGFKHRASPVDSAVQASSISENGSRSPRIS